MSRRKFRTKCGENSELVLIINPKFIAIMMRAIDNYVEKLKELYVITDVNAWCPQIRSEKSLVLLKKICLLILQ